MEFRILGPLEVRSEERTVALGSAKQRALLGVLLLHANEPVSTTRLVDELWGANPPATAEKLVQGYVHALRKLIGADRLVTQMPGYRVQVEPTALDLAEFERLAEEARKVAPEKGVELRRLALSLWRGPPLANVVLEGPARHEVARLAELRLTTQVERIEGELRLGRHAQLIGELEALVAANPYQERLCAQLMLALYRSGRQAEALQAYQAARRVLDDDLGLQPGQALRDLEASILRQDEELSFDGGAVHEPPRPAAPPVGPSGETRRSKSRRVMLLVPIVAVAASAAIAALALRGEPHRVTVPPNSAAVIDPRTNRVVAAVPVGIRPGPVISGGGSIWVGNIDDRTVHRIEPRTKTVVKTVLLGATPTGLAFGAGALWVAHGRRGQLSRVDPEFYGIKTADVATRAFGSSTGSVTYGDGWVWAAFGDSTFARIRPADGRPSRSTFAGAVPIAVVVGSGSVWVLSSGDATLRRFNPTTFAEGALRPISVGRRPSGIAFGMGDVWVANQGDDTVTRVDPGTNATQDIHVGDEPAGVAVGPDAVWVANAGDGTVSRIDPVKNEVVRRIRVGNAPTGVAVGDGYVWVTVQAR
jgi:YVTN family beta-propeller protein